MVGKEIRTIDNRAITEYKLVIKVCDRGSVLSMIRLDYAMQTTA